MVFKNIFTNWNVNIVVWICYNYSWKFFGVRLAKLRWFTCWLFGSFSFVQPQSDQMTVKVFALTEPFLQINLVLSKAPTVCLGLSGSGLKSVAPLAGYPLVDPCI